jgi:PAS domain S-box-containing protein
MCARRPSGEPPGPVVRRAFARITGAKVRQGRVDAADIHDMESPAGVEGGSSHDVRGTVRRVHVVLHLILIAALVVAGALPLVPRLTVAAVSMVALAVPLLGPSIRRLGRTELVGVANVLAGFAAFVVLPEAPLVSFGLALAGVVAAAITARPFVERWIVILAIGLEIAKLPIIAGSSFTSSIPLLSDAFGSPFDVIAGSIVQSAVLVAAWGITHGVVGILRRARHALVESEARHRRLMESLPNAVLVVADTRVVFANAAAQIILGDAATTVSGQYVQEVLGEDVLPGLRDTIREVRETGSARQIEGRAVGDGSDAGHLTAALSAIEFDGVPAVVVVLTDVSERHAAEQARREGEARFRTAFLNTATPFVLLSPDAGVLDLNDAAIRLFDCPRDEAVGRNWAEFVDPGDVGAFREFAGAASVGILNHLHAEASLRSQSDEPVRAEIDVTIDRDAEGGIRNFIVQVHDVTARHEAELALRLSEERYRNLFERNPVALYRTRPGGEILDVNEALLRLIGYRTKAELLSRRATEVYADPDDRRRIREVMERDGVVVGWESELIRSDGTRVWVRDTAHCIDDGDERVFEGALVDVTARRLADAALRRAAVQGETVAKLGQFALVASAIDELFARSATSAARVLEVETAGILLANASGRFDEAAVVGWPDESEVQLRSRIDALVGFAAGASRPVVVDAPSGAPPGSEPSAVGVAIRNGARVIGVVVAVDRTGASFQPDGLHFLRSVANVLAAAMDRHESRSQLEELVRSKDEFIASISHELRTPLTVVSGMAHELQDQWQDFSDEEIHELVALMVDQSADMQNLIEDLLVAARADIGRVPVHVVPMELAPAVEAVLAALPDHDGAVIRSDLAPVRAVADPTRVRQIVRNLVTNALRYGGRTITVSTGGSSDAVYVRVHDDGPGIPERQRDQIFEPYESVHRVIGTPASVGLGLTISRKLARLLGGELRYDVDGGSVFELTLPGAADALAVTPPAQDSRTNLSWSSIVG